MKSEFTSYFYHPLGVPARRDEN